MNDYGRTPNNPLRLNSDLAAKTLLKCLVTNDYYHILFHRLPSPSNSSPIEHYEICSGIGERYDIYIDTHAEKNLWIPPEGFKFEPTWIVLENRINFEPEYVIQKEYDYTLYNTIDRMSEEAPEIPYDDPTKYETLLDDSFGMNEFVIGFPETLFKRYVYQHSSMTIRLANGLIINRNTNLETYTL